MKTQTPQLDQPWLKNRRWAGGRVRDQSSKFIFFSVLFSVILNTIAVLGLISVWQDHRQGAALFIFPILLLLLGLVMLAWTIRQIRVRLMFGRSIFELETFPGIVGGYLAGTVRPAKPIAPLTGIHLELECVAAMRTDSFGKTTAMEDVLLRRKQTLSGAIPVRDGRLCIPVSFKIPPDARPTGGRGRNQIFWRLHARAGQRGADYDATFIVPVFDVDDGASIAVPQAESVAATLRKSHKSLAPEED